MLNKTCFEDYCCYEDYCDYDNKENKVEASFFNEPANIYWAFTVLIMAVMIAVAIFVDPAGGGQATDDALFYGTQL